MSPEPLAAERAYHRLKADLMSGRYSPGTLLVERLLAHEFGVSVSPVRDAAQRLVGEGMLVIAAGGGYQIPPLSKEGLLDLYNWHSHLLRMVIKSTKDIAPIEQQLGTDHLDAPAVARLATDWFRSLAADAANVEVASALQSANDRLQSVRLGEGLVLPNLDTEFEAVVSSTASGKGRDRFEAIWAYHRRRIRRAGKIFEAIVR